MHYHECALAKLRALLHLVAVIRLVVLPGVAFSAVELWERQVLYQELQMAFAAAGIHNPKQLGKRLQQLAGCGIERIDEVRCGVLWCVNE